MAIEALSNLTYPLIMPHITISSLPQNLMIILEAPALKLVGV